MVAKVLPEEELLRQSISPRGRRRTDPPVDTSPQAARDADLIDKAFRKEE
jgi:hypothetical protein